MDGKISIESASGESPYSVRTLEQVISVLKREDGAIRGRYEATALYLYGSGSRDELRPDSDVDIFIDFDPDGDFTFVELMGLQEFIAKKLGREVDLITRGGLHPRLKARIERSSVKVL